MAIDAMLCKGNAWVNQCHGVSRQYEIVQGVQAADAACWSIVAATGGRIRAGTAARAAADAHQPRRCSACSCASGL